MTSTTRPLILSFFPPPYQQPVMSAFEPLVIPGCEWVGAYAGVIDLCYPAQWDGAATAGG